MRLTFVISLLAMLLSNSFAFAQSQFSPLITVDDKAITRYELDQRIKLLQVFRAPGDIPDIARSQLVDDRLKQAAIDMVGLQLSQDELEVELAAFAQRANLSLDQFLDILRQNGIDQATFEEFVRIGITWRNYIRARFGSRVQVTEAEIDRAIGRVGFGRSGVEVLLSEIIIPAPPPQANQAMARAQQIARLTSTAAFSAQARNVSALPSRDNGGRLGWLPITNYPPQLQSIILALDIGEVTAPISIPNGVALFQMRGVREVESQRPVPDAVDYAAFYVSSQSEATAVSERVDTCDDLYGEARGLPAERLERDTLPLGEIPQDVALELARLDPGEVSTNLTRAEGETTVVLMLCSRQFGGAQDIDRNAVRSQIRSQRLGSLADALVEDLRAAATINGL